MIFTMGLCFGIEGDRPLESQKKSSGFVEFCTDVWSIIHPRPFNLTFDEGISYAQVTRIQVMNERSNYVRENMMIGAFVNFRTNDFAKLDFILQLSAYYPFYAAFNGMQQFPKNQIPYAFNTFFGLTYSIDTFKYILLDLSLGFHYMYHLTDEYHMNYVGLGFLGVMKFPIAKNWTIVNNYFFSYDDANLGSNKGIERFDACYQYHIDLGVQYSRKIQNSYSYISTK